MEKKKNWSPKRKKFHTPRKGRGKRIFLLKKMEKLKRENKEGGTRKGIGGNEKGRKEVKEERRK